MDRTQETSLVPLYKVALCLSMGAMIGPPEKPIWVHLQIDYTLIHKDQTPCTLSSDSKLKGHLHLITMLNGSLQKLIQTSISNAVRNKLKHTFFEVMPKRWRLFQMVAIETFTSKYQPSSYCSSSKLIPGFCSIRANTICHHQPKHLAKRLRLT